jgi:hypothetical protein
MGDRFNRNVLFTCLGSPGKPVVDTAGPLLLHPGDRVMLCSDGLWGACPTPSSPRCWRAPDLRCGARTGRTALRQAGAKSDNVTVLAVEWEAAEDATARAASPPRPGRRGVRLHHPGQPGRPAGATDELDEAEIERSIREINEAIQRSKKRKPAHLAAARAGLP